MKTTLFVIHILLLSGSLFSQNIEGTIVSKGGNGISYATVNILNEQSKVIKSVSTSEQGKFSIPLTDSLKKFSKWLQVEHISYQKKTVPFSLSQKEFNIELEENKNLLDQVVVKSRPMVKQKGDTMSYNVSSFAKEEDRSIGDVMNRMPGMQYTDDGKIFYNGQRVNNLLVEGDKILGNNTKLGGDAIRKDQVKDLEVISDYHDKKMMKGKTESEELAVNLRLKENLPVKLTSLHQLGVGYPKLYDVKSDLTAFNQRFKFISSTTFNNIGKDIAPENTFNNMINGSTASTPSIDKNRYYNNQSWANSTAFSKKLLKKYDFNLQGGFFADKEIFGSQNQQKYLLENDSYTYTEQQSFRSKPLAANIGATIESNEFTHFFRNRTQFLYRQHHLTSNSLLNDQPVDQKYSNRHMHLSNNLEYNKSLKKGYTLNFGWKFNSIQGTEDLFVSPNIAIEQLSNADLQQSVKLPNWNTTVNASLMKKVGNFNLSLGGDYTYTNQNLHSLLGNYENTFNALWLNQFRWREQRASLKPNLFYKKDKWQFSIGIPFNYGNWNLTDTIASYSNNENRWYAEPRAFAKYSFHDHHYIQLTGAFNKRFEGINTMYRSPILTNYRTMEQKLNSLNYKNAYMGVLDWKFSEAMSLFYLNAGGTYFSQTANFIISSRLTENGIENFTIPMDNKVDNWEARAGASKIVHSTKTNINLNLKSNWAFYNQFLNNDLYAYIQRTSNVEFKITQEFGSKTTLTSSWTHQNSSNKLRELNDKIPATNFTANRLDTRLSYIALGKIMASMSWKFHHVQQSNQMNWNYHFLDASVRYKMNKKYELELMLYNLTNVRRFETYSLNSIVQNHAVYELRGMMGLLKLNFAL
jgi:hypothetical protein